MTQSKQRLGNDTSILAQYRAVTNLQFVKKKKKSNKGKHNKVYLFYDIQYKVCVVGSYFKIYYTSDYLFPPVTTQN